MLFKCSNVQSSEFRYVDVDYWLWSIINPRISYFVLLTPYHLPHVSLLDYQLQSWKHWSSMWIVSCVLASRVGSTLTNQHTNVQHTTNGKRETKTVVDVERGTCIVDCGLWLMDCGFSHFTVHYKPPYSKSIKDFKRHEPPRVPNNK